MLFKRGGKWKVTFRMDENETEIDFLLIRKEHRRIIKNVRIKPREFLHASVVVDIDRIKISNVMRKTCSERRKINLLKNVMIRKQF